MEGSKNIIMNLNRILKPKIVVPILLLAHFILAFLTAKDKSATSDEGFHLARGIAIIFTRDFRLSVSHPPLINLIASLPVAFKKDLVVPTMDPYWHNTKADPDYRKKRFTTFLFSPKLNKDPLIILNRGRITIIILSVILGFFIYLWAKRLYGTNAGLLALFLYAFSPQIIAHSMLVTTDIGSTLFIFLSCLSLFNFLKKPGWLNFLLTSLTLGLAQLSKFSAILLYPLFFLLFVLWVSLDENRGFKNLFRFSISSKDFFLTIYSLLSIFILSLLIIWAGYGFETNSIYDLSSIGIETCENKASSLSLYLKCNTINVIEWLNLLPTTYFYGLGRTLLDTEKHMYPLVFLGRLTEKGLWYYYPVLFLIKTPLPIFFLLYLRLKTKKQLEDRKTKLFLILVPLFFFLFFCLLNNKQIGLRHLLIVYPFFYIFISAITADNNPDFLKNLKLKYSLAILLIWLAIETFIAHPNHLIYFNELTLGTERGLKISVVGEDWGQDRLALARYQKEHNLYPLYYREYAGHISARLYRLEFSEYNCQNKKPGYYAVHIIHLFRPLDENYGCLYGWLKDFKPIAKINHTIYIYKINDEDLRSAPTSPFPSLPQPTP